MPPLTQPPKTDYWRSLAELEKSPEFAEFVAREFPLQAEQGPVSRRTFMQLMAASFAFAGLDACRWQEDKIAPLSRRPEGHLPGMERHYSSMLDRNGFASPMRVTSYDGRPIKIEGNPQHPFGGGASTALDQATILELYDPDRSRKVKKLGRDASWEDFDGFLRGLAPNHRLRVLSEATSSPTIQRLRGLLREKLPESKWHEWEPLSRDNERAGARAAFGSAVRPIARLGAARTILALDGDFLVDHPASLRYARDFARGRRPEDGPMSRLYAVESTFSNTGAVSDHRLPLRSELVLPFALALDALVRGGTAPEADFLKKPKVDKFLRALADDLKQSGRASLVMAGPRQPAFVHAVCARLNDALGAVGTTVDYVQPTDVDRPDHIDDLRQLVQDVARGEVDTILVIGGNPVFDAPADLDLAAVLSRVENSIHLALHEDETSASCTWHVPRAHYLEGWGDARTWDGTVTLAQPLIAPLYDGLSVIELLAKMVGLEATPEALVRETVASIAPAADWRTALHEGFVEGTAYPPASAALRDFPAPRMTERQMGALTVENGQLEVVFTGSSHSFDGRYANNGWLQETPDFMTRLVWDNAALISPSTAIDLGIESGALLALSIGDRDVLVPAFVMPGQAPYSIALAVGHGRTRSGHVGGLPEEGVESIGFDVYPLRTSTGMWIATGVEVRDTGDTHELATVQDHWAMLDELGREGIAERLGDIVRRTTAEEVARPDFSYPVHGPPLLSLFRDHAILQAGTKEHRWGMATDLSTCIGCNACVVACQAENNVPIVGKTQVMRSREMAWIRVDRYFRGEPDDPEIAHQPVTCQQCEKAPCEQVCPVGATIHSDEGLNEMVYNRCVGTRYCLNNCPYKVRRFNFFEYHGPNGVPMEDLTKPRNDVRRLAFNPEVTVRSRGVMEKCSFCVQRIEKGKITARNENRALADGEIQSACMQACPTQAIVFGDLSDPQSRVSQLHKAETYRRGYALLAELNTIPRNRYLARVKNPNPVLSPPPPPPPEEEHAAPAKQQGHEEQHH